MIYLRKGQVVADIPNMVVYEATGFYNDGDSVICAPATNPEEPVCRYEAKYIAYGGMVYSISDPDQLLEEITKIDPNSLYGKDSKQVAVDKAVETIVPQDQTVQDKTKVASTTPNLLNSTASTTSQLLGAENIASTTPNVTPDIVPDVATTTPPITPDSGGGFVGESGAETSTTTPAIIGTDTGTGTGFDIAETSTSTPSTASSTNSGQDLGGVVGGDIVTDMTTTTPNITPDFIPEVTPEVTPDVIPEIAATTAPSVPTDPIVETAAEVVVSSEVVQ